LHAPAGRGSERRMGRCCCTGCRASMDRSSRFLGPKREVRQSRVTLPDGKIRLLRVVVDVVRDDMKVVTVYRTSKLAKYWRAR